MTWEMLTPLAPAAEMDGWLACGVTILYIVHVDAVTHCANVQLMPSHTVLMCNGGDHDNLLGWVLIRLKYVIRCCIVQGLSHFSQ